MCMEKYLSDQDRAQQCQFEARIGDGCKNPEKIKIGFEKCPYGLTTKTMCDQYSAKGTLSKCCISCPAERIRRKYVEGTDGAIRPDGEINKSFMDELELASELVNERKIECPLGTIGCTVVYKEIKGEIEFYNRNRISE